MKTLFTKTLLIGFALFFSQKINAQTIDFEAVMPSSGPQYLPEFTGVYQGDSEAFDANGDGHIDLMIIGNNVYLGQINTRLYFNDGLGNFTLSTDHIGVFVDVYRGSISSGDVDNDGDIDVLIAGEGSSSSLNTKLYLNNGSGIFTLSSTIMDQVTDAESKLADIDGDGDLDAILAGWTISANGMLKTYINDGNGTFSIGQTLNLLSWRSEIEIGDVDNDGDLDFFILGVLGQTSTIATDLYLNNGLGSYSLDTQNTFEDLNNGAISCVDTDGDGDLDVIFTGQNSSGISKSNIYLNNSSGLFTLDPNSTTIAGAHFGEHAVGDIDSDGDDDLIITGLSSVLSTSLTQVYRNNGGVFTLDVNQSISPVYYSSIEMFDVDGDAALDFVICGQISNNNVGTELYYNDGNGSFNRVSGTPIPEVQFGATAISDVDSDGDLDIFISGESDFGFISQLFLNQGNNVYTTNQIAPFIKVKNSSAEFFDGDGDGDQDLIVIGTNSSLIATSTIYLNDGNGNFTVDMANTIEPLINGDIAIGDLNSDGFLDIIAAGSNGTLRVTKMYMNNGAGIFTLVSPDPFTGISSGDLSLADVDNDSDLDLFTTGYQQAGINNTAKLYLNDGTGIFSLNTGSIFYPVDASSNDFGDIDDDGDLDLIVTGRASGNLPTTTIYINDGTGTFSLDLINAIENVNFGSVKFADFDNDGDQDIVICGRKEDLSYTTLLYSNNGIGEFSVLSGLVLAPVTSSDIVVADLNNDSKIDFVLLGNDGFRKRGLIYQNLTCDLSNLSIVQNGLTLEASINGVSYQWIDCSNGNSILPGETNSSFTPTQNGSYAVQVIDNSCSTTSTCFDVDYLSISELNSQFIAFYPNPADKTITLQTVETTQVSISSANGTILTNLELNGETTIDVSSFAVGIYFIRTAEGQTLKFIKN
jgi:hypothetical protein